MTAKRHLDGSPSVPTWLDPLPMFGVPGEPSREGQPNHADARVEDDEHEDLQPTAGSRFDRNAHLRRLQRIERQVRDLQRTIDEATRAIESP
jgi:hypothetical protein